MQVAVIAAVLLACVSGCASGYARKPFSELFNGSVTGNRVMVEGRMDTSGINFYSLQARDDASEGSNCVALILNEPDRKRAKSLHDKVIEVRGKPIGMGDLNNLLPNYSGEINGRPWSGTKCDGQFVIYVDELRVL